MQKSESVFAKACYEITQNLLIVEEPTRQKAKTEIKKVCAKYSLERIPRNYEILAKVNGSDFCINNLIKFCHKFFQEI